MSTISFVYIYCSRLGLHRNWIQYYPQIQGVFNDSLTLGKKIKEDLGRVYQAQTESNRTWLVQSIPKLRKPVKNN
jgi:hypothetical protein